MDKLTWLGCVLLAAAVSPVRGVEESVEVTIRGRLKLGTAVGQDAGPTTITVGQGEAARVFTLTLPDDPAVREAARGLDGKAARVSGLWERKVVVLSGRARLTPGVKPLWVNVNGVRKAIPVSGPVRWEAERRVVEFVRVKSLLPAAEKTAEPAKPAAGATKGTP